MLLEQHRVPLHLLLLPLPAPLLQAAAAVHLLLVRLVLGGRLRWLLLHPRPRLP
jgi:hypothetical protein